MQDQSTQVGCCQCGCGRLTAIAQRNDRRANKVKGRSMKFLPGHNRRVPRSDVVHEPMFVEIAPALREVVCVVCGSTWARPAVPGRPPRVCSTECRAEDDRRRAREWRLAHPERVALHPSRQKQVVQARNAAYYEANREAEIQRALAYARGPGKAAKQARDIARFARTRGAADAERFTLDEIFERDGGVCHLCGDSVVRAGQTSMSATMDHVVPVTRGGAHTRANVRLAHRGCNTRKGNRVVIATSEPKEARR